MLSDVILGWVCEIDSRPEVPSTVLQDWAKKVAKMENDLIQIHTYTPCINKCGKSVRYSYSVGPGMCPDCAWKEIQEHREFIRQQAELTEQEEGCY